MIGTRQLERVVAQAEQRGAKLVLVGDPEQLQAIEAGAAFRSVAERHGGVEIMEVRRQRVDWQRDATRALATGRTAEAIRAYEEAGHVHAADTRDSARRVLIRGWDEDRLSQGISSTIILTHTHAECDELNGMARDALRRDGSLGTEFAVETTRGRLLFGAGDRIMFLRNERDLGVKNGTLATIEHVDPRRMAVRLDDGREIRFDTKNYADVTHGYAATIHKTQGVTVERTHVLATPGLDRHAAYVALSRHRDGVELHYGRDDFETQDRLVATLSRDRSKNMASDYPQRFAERRQIIRRGEPVERTPAIEPPARRRGMFDGLRLSIPDDEIARPARAPARGMFDGLVARAAQMPPPEHGPLGLDSAVGRYARAYQEGQRMIDRGASELEPHKAVRITAAKALDQIRPGASRDLDAAFAGNPELVDAAASGRPASAIRAMQMEAELRANPDLRADRFVQAWQQLRARREGLGGWRNADARERVDGQLQAMAKGIEKDPAMGGALSKRGGELGLSPQWSPEWSRRSPDGGMVREISDLTRARAIGAALTHELGRDRGIGL